MGREDRERNPKITELKVHQKVHHIIKKIDGTIVSIGSNGDSFEILWKDYKNKETWRNTNYFIVRPIEEAANVHPIEQHAIHLEQNIDQQSKKTSKKTSIKKPEVAPAASSAPVPSCSRNIHRHSHFTIFRQEDGKISKYAKTFMFMIKMIKMYIKVKSRDQSVTC